MKKFDVYEMVTNLIIKHLYAGVMPWKFVGAIPRNLVSKRPCRGFNFRYLLSFSFDRPYFPTFNQVKNLSDSIRKGAKSHLVVFWESFEVKRKDGSTDEVTMLKYNPLFPG